MGGDPFYSSAGWRKIRLEALRRDQYRCRHCGADLRGKGGSRVDHILPRSTHPHLSLKLGNLQSLCPPCDNRKHRDKGGKIIDDTGFDGWALNGEVDLT